MSFVSTSIAHQRKKPVLEVIPKSQHRPIEIQIKAIVSLQEVFFRRRYNINKADWGGFAKSDDMCITDIVPIPDNYGSFVDIVKKASRQNLPRGCRISYICDLTDETKELYKDYKIKFEDDPFSNEITETGNTLSDKIAEAQQKNWQT